jgi:asparagine synthase (glutamine-hydrolysing)
VPVAKWLKEDMKSLLLNTLSRKKIEREDLFDYDYIKEMLWSYEAGARDVGRQIWALFMFELWYDRWVG